MNKDTLRKLIEKKDAEAVRAFAAENDIQITDEQISRLFSLKQNRNGLQEDGPERIIESHG